MPCSGTKFCRLGLAIPPIASFGLGAQMAMRPSSSQRAQKRRRVSRSVLASQPSTLGNSECSRDMYQLACQCHKIHPTSMLRNFVGDFENIWEGQSGAPRTRAKLEGERQSELADLCAEQGGEHTCAEQGGEHTCSWACQRLPQCSGSLMQQPAAGALSFPERQLGSAWSQVCIMIIHRELIIAE